MAPKSTLADIKRDLESYVGEKVRLKANKGRKKILEQEGVLESAYANIFVIKSDEGATGRRFTYSYADLLTEAVELVVCSSGGQEMKIEAHSR